MTKYVCPKCHAIMWSSKKSKYYVCGGKYKTTQEAVEEMFGHIDSMEDVK
jgi:protein-arginine kinase activator protein McsA